LSSRFLRLETKDVETSGLAAGLTGIALAHVALERVFPAAGHTQRAEEAITESIERLGKETLGPDLYAGFAGVAWVIDQLAGNGEEEDGCSVIDDALAQYLDHAPWTETYDLISGLVGIGIYALDRLPRKKAAALIDAVVGHLAETADHAPPHAHKRNGNGKARGRGHKELSWRSNPLWIPEQYRKNTMDWNLGLAHGVPAVIAFLGRVCASPCSARTRHKARTLLDGAVAWVLAEELPRDSVGCFANGFLDAKPEEGTHAARLAWCYGDPGVAACLLVAADAVGEKSWKRAAVRTALRAAARSEKTSQVRDAGICHGATGVAHAFHRMYLASGEEELATAARLWFKRALAMQTERGGFAGFKSWEPTANGKLALQPTTGFLTGAAGVALALSAAVTEGATPWDRVLSLP
jgi:hypothetical protein